MSDKVLLRHFSLNGRKFKSEHCEGVFAFREFGPEDSEELKYKVGLECDRDAFEERMQSDSNYKALVYKIEPTKVLHYVFDTRDAMGCTYNEDTSTYYDKEENYYIQDFHITQTKLYQLNELIAVQHQFTYSAARQLCKFKGLLHHAMPTDKILLQFLKPEQHAFRSLDCTDTYAFREYYSGLDHNLIRHGAYCDRAKYLEIFHGHTNFHVITYYKSFSVDYNPVYNTIEYVFASFKAMNCVSLTNTTDILWHGDLKLRYTHNGRSLCAHDRLRFTNERTAITEQFNTYEARTICQNNGLLPFQIALSEAQKVNTVVDIAQECCPCTILSNVTSLNETANVMSSNVANVMLSVQVVNATALINRTSTLFNATTVPVSEMELLTSAASLLLASPVLLAPVILAIHNVCDMFFDGLANWLTNLSKKE